VGPEAVVVDEGGEALDFAAEPLVGTVCVKGVVLALEGVAEKKDVGDGGVCEEKGVEVAARQLVDFVDDD